MIFWVLLMLTACTEDSNEVVQLSSDDSPEVNKQIDHNHQQSSPKKKSTVQVWYGNQQYALVPVGNCQPGSDYMFWAKKAELLNATAQVGPRIQLIGNPKETVVKFYLNDELLVSQVLRGEQRIIYDRPQLDFKIPLANQESLKVSVNCIKP